MQLLHGIDGLKSLPQGVVLSVGNFDGIHLGHRRILDLARQLRGDDAAGVAVVTFEPHPLTVLRPQLAPPRLSPLALKQSLLEPLGVDHLVILPPTPDVLNLTAEAFWQILRDDVQPAHMIEGTSFNFGKGRGGSIDRLREWSATSAVRLHVVEAVQVPLLDLQIVPVSSSLIRWLLMHGRARDAAICLGRPYVLEGTVIKGHQRGRTIGVPTANLDCGEQLVPAEGVYVGRCNIGGASYAAAISIGTMPTFGENQLQLEVHVIDFDGDLYGQTMRVELIDWVREQWRFADIEALKVRMAGDIAWARGARMRGWVIRSRTFPDRAVPSPKPPFAFVLQSSFDRIIPPMADQYQAILDILGKSKRVLVTTHVRPDGDALGTAAAMVLGMRAKGIDSHVVLLSHLPNKYAFVFKELGIEYTDVERGWPDSLSLDAFDAFLVVDTGTWSQLPGLKERFANWRVPKIVVDHHLTQENWADAKLVVTEAAAAGEIAAELLEQWDVELTEPIARALFLAISSDTGWFQFSNTRPFTLRLAAMLIEAGVNTDQLYQLVYQNERAERVTLQTRAQQSLELLCDQRLAVMRVKKSDFEQTGGNVGDTENLINIPLQIRTIEVSLLFVEPLDGGAIRVSLRSKGGVDVARFAEQFGGGGHARAAGLKVNGSLQAVHDQVVGAMTEKLETVKVER